MLVYEIYEYFDSWVWPIFKKANTHPRRGAEGSRETGMPRLRFRMPKMQFGINFYDIKTINSVLWYFRLSYPLSFFFSSWSYFSKEKLF